MFFLKRIITLADVMCIKDQNGNSLGKADTASAYGTLYGILLRSGELYLRQ